MLRIEMGDEFFQVLLELWSGARWNAADVDGQRRFLRIVRIGSDGRYVDCVSAPQWIAVADVEAGAVEIGTGDACKRQKIIGAASRQLPLHRSCQPDQRVAATFEIHSSVRGVPICNDPNHVTIR